MMKAKIFLMMMTLLLVVAGVWMQAKPTLSVNDILAVMQKTCVNDEFTTNVAKIPSGNKVQAGLGKIDCLAGLKEILASM